eukprot:g2603.t1
MLYIGFLLILAAVHRTVVDGSTVNATACNAFNQKCRPYDIGDGVCDAACANEACGWDDGDCIETDEPCYSMTVRGCEACVETTGCVFCDNGGSKIACVSESNPYFLHSNLTRRARAAEDCEALSVIAGFSDYLNDPLLELQRHYLDAIDVGAVWSINITGHGVLIHFSDAGLDSDHEEFKDKYVQNARFGPPDVAESCSDQNSVWNHGTAVAGYAVATANNSKCGVGVAFNAVLTMSSWIYGFPSQSNFSSLSDMLFHEWTTGSFGSGVGVDIMSNSWGYNLCGIIAASSSGDTSTCPFRSNDLDDNPSSPCVTCDARTDWERLTRANDADCVDRVRSYCTSTRQGIRDLACLDMWDLFASCSSFALPSFVNAQLKRGVTCGRQGRGVVYIFAAGNEFLTGESSNLEGFTNSIYTISVGALGPDGETHAYYSTTGTAVHVSAPGGDATFDWESHMVTTMPGNECGDGGQGTSYACPILAGVVALMLEANPDLTWRQVQHILAETSTKVNAEDPSWTVNSAGFHHSTKFGFGRVNASAAVDSAQLRTGRTRQALMATEWTGRENLRSGTDPVVINLAFNTTDAVISSIEHAVLYVSLEHPSPHDVRISVTSPSGTVSELLWPTLSADSAQSYPPYEFDDFKIMTLQFWGETNVSSIVGGGTWQIALRDEISEEDDSAGRGNLTHVVLAVYGQCHNSSASCRFVEGMRNASNGGLAFEGFFDQSEYENVPFDDATAQCEALRIEQEMLANSTLNTPLIDVICESASLECAFYCGEESAVNFVRDVLPWLCLAITALVVIGIAWGLIAKRVASSSEDDGSLDTSVEMAAGLS